MTYRPLLRALGLGVALLLAAVGPLPAQIPYVVNDLAPGVFAVIRRPPSGSSSDSNVLVIINDHDVIVVDANVLPTSAREVIAEIRKRTAKPVRYVINTHWHGDHLYGNAEYRKAWPGVEFIQHPETAKGIVGRMRPILVAQIDSGYENVMRLYRNALSVNRTPSGKTLSDTARRIMNTTLQFYDKQRSEMLKTDLIPGTLLVADSLTFVRGDRTIVVKFLGRGNTAGDLIVNLPKERVVATGDLVVSPFPFGFESYYAEWFNTLRALKETNAQHIVPGHGEMMTDWGYVDQLIALIESVWVQTKRAVAEGKSLEATRAAVSLEPFRGQLPERMRDSFDANFGQPAVEAAFNEVTRGDPVPQSSDPNK
jgi:glyoxylase-like metal-dependent hydrolase (beta-lactamase superfamily II)